MSKAQKIVVVVVLAVAAAGAIIAIKSGQPNSITTAEYKALTSRPTSNPSGPIPRLVVYSSQSCGPCQRLMPILVEIQKEYSGRMAVQVIDVNENESASAAQNIRATPTLIFYDAAGKEISRHEGLLSKQDILAKWKELGVSFVTGE